MGEPCKEYSPFVSRNGKHQIYVTHVRAHERSFHFSGNDEYGSGEVSYAQAFLDGFIIITERK